MIAANAFGFAVDTTLSFDAADRRVREELAREGFGVLTQIDVQATMRQRLGVEFPRYEILGACNPPLAHRALTTEPAVGLLLPCNVVVAEGGGGAVSVSFMDPVAVLDIARNPALEPIAREAGERLRRVAAALSG